MDLSKTALQILASSPQAEASLRLPHNKRYIVESSQSTYATQEEASSFKHGTLEAESDKGRIKGSANSERESTPFVEFRPLSAVLRLDVRPHDPSCGWVFGSSEDDVDFVAGRHKDGVSRKQFQINYNWDSAVLVLRNLSGRGTKMITADGVEIIWKTRSLVSREQHIVAFGLIHFKLQVPNRSETQEREFLSYFRRIRQEVDAAQPKLTGLSMQGPGIITPQVIGLDKKYFLGSFLGQGSFAMVYKATHHQTGNVYAAKQFQTAPSGKKLMEEELQILSALKKHKHIIGFVDSFSDPAPTIIMQLALRNLLSCKIETTSECIDLLRQVADGLSHIHGAGITHRDLKPENILLTQAVPKFWVLADFGISKLYSLGVKMKTFAGTTTYMAPELRAEGKEYTNKVDIWALGVIGIEVSVGFTNQQQGLLPRRIGLNIADAWYVAVLNQLDCSPVKEDLRGMLIWNPEQRLTAEEARGKLEWRAINATAIHSPGLPASSGRRRRHAEVTVKATLKSGTAEGGDTIRLSQLTNATTRPVTSGRRSEGPSKRPKLTRS